MFGMRFYVGIRNGYEDRIISESACSKVRRRASGRGNSADFARVKRGLKALTALEAMGDGQSRDTVEVDYTSRQRDGPSKPAPTIKIWS